MQQGCFFLWLFSCNFDDQLSQITDFVILCICWDTAGENTGLWQLPRVSSAFHTDQVFIFMHPCVFRAMVEDHHSTEEKIRLLRKASETHTKLYKGCMSGKGWDRHLFALYVACKGLKYVRYITYQHLLLLHRRGMYAYIYIYG